MIHPRQLLAATFTIALLLLSSSLYESRARPSYAGAIASWQTDERERGIQLYEQGETIGAIRALQAFVKQQKNDVRAWHHLGLALSRNGNLDDARKAYEKAAKIGSQLIAHQLEQMTSPKEIYGRINPLRTVLGEAADSADKYLELSSKPSRKKISEWRERAEVLRTFEELSDELKDSYVYGALEVTTKARILSKPSPQYTEEARQNQMTGRVVLLLILSANGTVKGITPVARLAYGLTEKAVQAARQIKFTPATIDGKPVSQFINVEYNFNIY